MSISMDVRYVLILFVKMVFLIINIVPNPLVNLKPGHDWISYA